MSKRKKQKFPFLERFLLHLRSSLISPMKKLPAPLAFSRPGWFAATFFSVALGCWLLAPTGFSQAPSTVSSNAVLMPLLSKLKTQQDQLAANQTKIEAQTTQLKEEIRQTKIYAARAGSRR